MFDSSEFEYADIKIKLLGLELDTLRGIKYKKSQDKELVYAQGNQPRTIQRKNKKYEGSLKVLKSGYDQLDTAAVAAGYEDITDVPGKFINVTVTYQKGGTNMLSTDNLSNVEFTESEDGMNQGDSFGEVTLPFIFLRKTKV